MKSGCSERTFCFIIEPDPQDEADAVLQEFQKILDWKEEPEMEMENEGIAVAMTSRFDQSVID